MNIGIAGLGVMGRSLALNFARNGYSVAGYDKHLKIEPSRFKDRNIAIFDSLDGLVAGIYLDSCLGNERWQSYHFRLKRC